MATSTSDGVLDLPPPPSGKLGPFVLTREAVLLCLLHYLFMFVSFIPSTTVNFEFNCLEIDVEMLWDACDQVTCLAVNGMSVLLPTITLLPEFRFLLSALGSQSLFVISWRDTCE